VRIASKFEKNMSAIIWPIPRNVASAACSWAPVTARPRSRMKRVNGVSSSSSSSSTAIRAACVDQASANASATPWSGLISMTSTECPADSSSSTARSTAARQSAWAETSGTIGSGIETTRSRRSSGRTGPIAPGAV
jgi:hypothetical protein